MGDWRKDQSKQARRYIWGQTRGEHDSVRRDFLARAKSYPAIAALRAEKIGSELHLWRERREPSGRTYWASCLRFVDDEWGYWTVFYRPDERRWRATGIRDLPLSRALAETSRLIDSLWRD